MTAEKDPRDVTNPGVGLVGVGWMGRLHTKAYTAIPIVYPEIGVEPRLVHVTDPSPDRATYARDLLGYARSASDYRAVVDDPEVDVVSICGPNHIHREVAIACAEKGKPFWIEKPVGRNVEDTRAVAGAARASGVVTTVGYNYRGVPAVERIRQLISRGDLGRITNVRSAFFCGYAAEPKSALSWRFRRAYAGSGALGDLLSHVVDLVQYLVAPISEISAVLSTVHDRRPVLPMGVGTHFTVVTGGELAPVENDDHAAALVRFADGSRTAGAVGTLEASRVIVGPQCSLAVEIYGTEGSATWNFEQMNELHLCRGRSGPDVGYTTILANSAMGDYSFFQPGPANSMSFDDLKLIEAKKFLTALSGGARHNSTVQEAEADAEVLAAALASSEDGKWHGVREVRDATFGRIAGSDVADG
jgi:predicted dehydrogenase